MMLATAVCMLCAEHSCSVVSESLWPHGARQAPLSVGFSRQGYWSGWPCPPAGDLPNPDTEPRSPALQADSLPSEPPGKPSSMYRRAVCARVERHGGAGESKQPCSTEKQLCLGMLNQASVVYAEDLDPLDPLTLQGNVIIFVALEK